MPRVVLDENVSLQVVSRLEALGYEVTAVSKHPERGMHDEAELVERFLKTHPPDDFAGHLVFLSPSTSRIR